MHHTTTSHSVIVLLPHPHNLPPSHEIIQVYLTQINHLSRPAAQHLGPKSKFCYTHSVCLVKSYSKWYDTSW